MGDIPVLPLVEMPVANVYNKRFHDVVTDPFQNNPYVAYTWMEPEGVAQKLLGSRANLILVGGGVVIVLAAGVFFARKRRRRPA